MSNFLHAVYTANINATSPIPFSRTPEKTDGVCIFAEAFTACVGKSVLVRVLVPALQRSGDAAMSVALFIDDQLYAVRTSSVTPPGAGYFTPIPLDYCHIPGDGLSHTYRVHVGPLSGEMVLNGVYGSSGFGSTMAATLTIEEK